ncbi:hypothetical protein HKBW3S06_01050, partial [Candidatus Hakubella thermalkaliphila]
ISAVVELYEKLLRLQRQGINGIWARILKNAFAPLFAGEFDYIAGNPPWVNWESLPEEYRKSTKPLWEAYGLFPHGGMDTILGKGKKDISMLMTYVSMDKYLKRSGRLGFLITQSVFKTAGAGQGFRSFRLDEKTPLVVLHVDDMVELQPFEGASNRTSVVILQKGRSTKYPMSSYLYWKKTVRGRSIALDSSLDDAMNMTQRKQFVAEPVSEKDPTSPWITGRPKALRAVKKVLGQSDYVAHAGAYTGGANGVYWVNIVDRRPDGLVVVSNITEGAKRKVESIQAAIESDLLYPLLRGRDVRRWRTEPAAYIIMAQDPKTRRGIDEDEMKTHYPKTYQYLKRFEGALRERAAFRRYFTRKDRLGRIVETAPFYSMFDVGDYTFAPYKVVWREQSSSLMVATVGIFDSKCVMPDHKLMLVDCGTEQEAYYLCAALNSSPAKFAAVSYAIEIQMDPHILRSIRISIFDPKQKTHLALAELSEEAHQAVELNDQETVNRIEEHIDTLVAQIWGLTKEELKEIRISLEEMAS